jgi:hypothetical protein
MLGIGSVDPIYYKPANKQLVPKKLSISGKAQLIRWPPATLPIDPPIVYSTSSHLKWFDVSDLKLHVQNFDANYSSPASLAYWAERHDDGHEMHRPPCGKTASRPGGTATDMRYMQLSAAPRRRAIRPGVAQRQSKMGRDLRCRASFTCTELIVLPRSIL